MITVSENIDLRPFNTFGISARCDRWISYTEAADIPEILKICRDSTVISIGAGSNMLFTGDFHGTIIHSEIRQLDFDRNGNQCSVRIGAGISFDNVIEQCCRTGLWGIENLSGIPGDAGSAAVQNIGAYGVEIKDVLDSVHCYDTMTRRFIELKREECAYGYRSSLFKSSNRRYIITGITVNLTYIPEPQLGYAGLSHLAGNSALTPLDVRQEVIRLRDSKLPDPAKTGNAGSFFKNPVLSASEYDNFISRVNKYGYGDIPKYETPDGVKIPAAWLIEKCGFKGSTMGNAGVWHKQPLVLINATGHATGQDIVALEHAITAAVYDHFGIRLHPEVEHI